MHHYQRTLSSAFGIEQLLWPGNSPNLNMTKPCWYYLKRRTIYVWIPAVHAEMVKQWEKEWTELEQERIQRWVERIHFHVQEVVRLHGGNVYHEGRGPNRES